MATQALYNKWRGQTFADILGQEHITTTLLNQVKAGRIGHAYLFTGLRGTGKTSTARIMAKAVNCVGGTDTPPCNRCHICRSITEGRSLDLVEIDAASNRGIDEIRDLRDKVSFSPSECRYKVYVIDEVHMLTNEAFNALLKTLEEPPSHVIFILCTTEAHRLPDTVLSRCQRFDFRRGAVSVLLAKLGTICEREGIAISQEALEFIARRASGSFRDAESLLEQLAVYGAGALPGQGQITLEQVQDILGTVSSTLVTQLIISLVSGNVPTGLRVINQAIDNGAEPRQFLTQILDQLRALMLLKVGGDDDLHVLGEESLSVLRPILSGEAMPLDTLVRAIKLFNEAGNGLRQALRPQLPLEMAFIEATLQMGPVEAVAVQPTQAAVSGAGGEQKGNAQRQREPARRTAPAERPRPGGHAGTGSAPEASVPTPQAETVAVEPPAQTGGDQAAVPEEKVSAPRAVPATPAEPVISSAAAAIPPTTPAGVVERGEEASSQDQAPVRASKLTLEWVQGKWRQVLTRMKVLNPNVQGLLNSARPIEVRDETIVLACEATFHRDRLSEDKRRDLVERVLSEIMGVPCRVQCTVDTAPREAEADSVPAGSGDLFSAVAPRETLHEENQDYRREDAPAEVSTAAETQAEILSHPAVKALQKRGGKISKVSPIEEEKQEDHRGQ